jgi:hypothetical protein
MGKIFTVTAIVLTTAASYNWIMSGSREPSLTVNLSDDDAFTLASMILARGKVLGCGDMRVVGQLQRTIKVECGHGDRVREFSVTYYPDFEVDFEPVADRTTFAGIMDEERLARIHCVQYPDGSWEKSYLRESDARRRAEEISNELNAAATVFYGYEGTWAQVGTDGAGNWSFDLGESEHDSEGYGPDGCRI